MGDTVVVKPPGQVAHMRVLVTNVVDWRVRVRRAVIVVSAGLLLTVLPPTTVKTDSCTDVVNPAEQELQTTVCVMDLVT